MGLARQAGLEIGTSGAIRVDETLRTSDPAIFAVGDCAETRNVVTESWGHCRTPRASGRGAGSSPSRDGPLVVSSSAEASLRHRLEGVAAAAVAEGIPAPRVAKVLEEVAVSLQEVSDE